MKLFDSTFEDDWIEADRIADDEVTIELGSYLALEEIGVYFPEGFPRIALSLEDAATLGKYLLQLAEEGGVVIE